MPQGPWTTRFTHGGLCMYTCISSIVADRGSTPDGQCRVLASVALGLRSWEGGSGWAV